MLLKACERALHLSDFFRPKLPGMLPRAAPPTHTLYLHAPVDAAKHLILKESHAFYYQ